MKLRHGEVRIVDGKRVASPEYRSWQMMRNRCQNPKAENYDGYGAKGIMVCDDWESFECFLEDMGRRPTMRHTLERVDARDNYAPHNCIWADKARQSQNRPGFVKLSMPLARQMRAIHAGGGHTYRSIAVMFGIGETTAANVIRKKTWVYA